MAKGLFTFIRSVFQKPKTQETIATTLTRQGTVVKKAIDKTTKDKIVQHIYSEGSHMANLGVESTSLRTVQTANNMAQHGGHPYYAFSSLRVNLNNGNKLTFHNPAQARDFFSTANKYQGYMKV